METCACCANSVHTHRLHEHLKATRLKYTCAWCGGMSVLWLPVCATANAFNGKLSRERVVGAAWIIFVVLWEAA